MNHYSLLIHWLVMAAVAEWLLARTVTRVAIFIPMPPQWAELFRLLGTVGQMAVSLAGVLALVVLALFARHEWQQGAASESWGNRWGSGVAAAIIGLAALSILFLFVPPAGWLGLAGHFLPIALITLLVVRAMPRRSVDATALRWALSWAEWVALLIPALALVAGRLHQALPALAALLDWPGLTPLTMTLFNLGELLVVIGALALWWAYGRGAAWRAWLLGAVPALLFAALYLGNGTMTGILTIWSTGLTLYLPWPLYAVAIWLASVTVAAPRAWARGAGWAILLLAASGYAPQLSTQAFFGLIALYLLTGVLQQNATKDAPELHPGYPFANPAWR